MATVQRLTEPAGEKGAESPRSKSGAAAKKSKPEAAAARAPRAIGRRLPPRGWEILLHFVRRDFGRVFHSFEKPTPVSSVGSVAGRARENPYPFASLTHRGFRGWLTQSGRPRRPKIPERPLRRDFIGLRCQPPYPRLACLGGKLYTAHPLPPPMHRHCLGEIAFRHGRGEIDI